MFLCYYNYFLSLSHLSLFGVSQFALQGLLKAGGHNWPVCFLLFGWHYFSSAGMEVSLEGQGLVEEGCAYLLLTTYCLNTHKSIKLFFDIISLKY